MLRPVRIIISLLVIFLILIGVLIGVAIYTGARKGITEAKKVSPNKALTQLSTVPSPTNLPAYPPTHLVTDDDPSYGPRDAKVSVVEFSDFQCPYCRQVHGTVRTLMLRYGDRVRFIYRDFPIRDTHAEAQKAGEAGECAQEQGDQYFWSLHDKIFANQNRIEVIDLKRYAAEVGLEPYKFNECLASGRYAAEVEEDFRAGIMAGVKGTPTFFINNQKAEGAISLEDFESILRTHLAK